MHVAPQEACGNLSFVQLAAPLPLGAPGASCRDLWVLQERAGLALNTRNFIHLQPAKRETETKAVPSPGREAFIGKGSGAGSSFGLQVGSYLLSFGDPERQ